MDALFKEIRTTVSQEAQIVKAVFPSPFAVMEVFLQRVFAQVVSSDLTLFRCSSVAHRCLTYRRFNNISNLSSSAPPPSQPSPFSGSST
jgi:hypothetical protein